MGLVTDDERRDVARKLRELRLSPWDDAACEIAQCAGIVCCNSECHGSDEKPECAMALCDRLADLIEQQTSEQTNPQESSLSASLCDRDALLALAGEFESGARVARARKWNEPANAAMAIALADEYETNARRIREALGVVA